MSDERENLGIGERLPRTLQEALDALKEDASLRQALGERMIREYLMIKELEIEFIAQEGNDWYKKWY
jgi:glutamine synthetase